MQGVNKTEISPTYVFIPQFHPPRIADICISIVSGAVTFVAIDT